jgi:hypothetical protein
VARHLPHCLEDPRIVDSARRHEPGDHLAPQGLVSICGVGAAAGGPGRPAGTSDAPARSGLGFVARRHRFP